MKIVQQFVSEAIVKSRSYGRGNKKTHITIHETANTRKGANAATHARLQSNKNSREASWHWQVDDTQAIQSFDHNIRCWHAGDGNSCSIAIEICVNSDGDFKQAVANAAELTRHIMQLENIPIQNVVQHNKWTGKNCPTFLRNVEKGLKWTDFIQLVRVGGDSNPKKEVDEMAEHLPKTQQDDMRALLQRAFENKVFGVSHASKVDKMTRGQATDLLISYVARTTK